MPPTLAARLPLRRKLLPMAFLASTLLVASAPSAAAQETRVSPHETISTVVDGNRLTVVYGRPYIRNPKTGAPRKIWGGLVPYGKVWRMGADEATLLITQKPIVLGGTPVSAGAYTLFLQPEADGSAALILNRQIGQWGEEYDPAQTFARIALTRTTLAAPVTQFTMAIGKQSGGGLLRLSWESTAFAAPFTVVH